MSLIIKGMDMPERLPDLADTNAITIYNCQIFIDSKGNATIRIRGHREEYPVVKILTPHGRLIDADALIKKLERHRDMCGDIELAHGIDEAIRILEKRYNNHRSGGERVMNHDATHCDDYKVNKCPKKCYRAQLTQDLRKRPDLHFVPISWANFKGTNECPLTKEVE